MKITQSTGTFRWFRTYLEGKVEHNSLQNHSRIDKPVGNNEREYLLLVISFC